MTYHRPLIGFAVTRGGVPDISLPNVTAWSDDTRRFYSDLVEIFSESHAQGYTMLEYIQKRKFSTNDTLEGLATLIDLGQLTVKNHDTIQCRPHNDLVNLTVVFEFTAYHIPYSFYHYALNQSEIEKILASMVQVRSDLKSRLSSKVYDTLEPLINLTFVCIYE